MQVTVTISVGRKYSRCSIYFDFPRGFPNSKKGKKIKKKGKKKRLKTRRYHSRISDLADFPCLRETTGLKLKKRYYRLNRRRLVKGSIYQKDMRHFTLLSFIYFLKKYFRTREKLFMHILCISMHFKRLYISKSLFG